MKNVDEAYLIRHLTSMKERAETTLSEFSNKLLGDYPGYEMEWADKVYAAAARAEFANGWLAFLNDDSKDIDCDKAIKRTKVGIMLNGVAGKVQELSRNISNQSTSMSSNKMAMERLEVNARFLDDLKFAG